MRKAQTFYQVGNVLNMKTNENEYWYIPAKKGWHSNFYFHFSKLKKPDMYSSRHCNDYQKMFYIISEREAFNNFIFVKYISESHNLYSGLPCKAFENCATICYNHNEMFHLNQSESRLMS